MKRPAPGAAKDAKKPRKADVSRSYKGFTIPSGDWQIDRVDILKMTPVEFFNNYIAKRKPCVLVNALQSPDFASFGNWTDEYLKKKAGDAVLQVEQRNSTKSFFGESAPRIPMRFSDLLTHVENKCPFYYLTSQTEDYTGSDLPALLASPLTRLSSDFQLRPELFASLVPYQLNMWLGQAADGASSGLHHDFHDNLYLLLRGAKRFHIFSPRDAPKMHTRGHVTRVHNTGVLVYSSNRGITADGIPAPLLHRFLKKDAARLELAAAELDAEVTAARAAGEDARANALQARADAARAEQDAAIDLSMDLAMEYSDFIDIEDGNDDDAGDGLDNGASDADAADADAEDEAGEAADSDDDAAAAASAASARAKARAVSRAAEEKAHVFPHFSGVPRALLLAQEPATSANMLTREIRARCALAAGVAAYAESPVAGVQAEDDVITLDDVFRMKPEWKTEYADFLESNKGVVYMIPGDALYLPAGWFHEVTSCSPPDLAAPAAAPPVASGPGHMAINYWFHPPSADAPTAPVPAPTPTVEGDVANTAAAPAAAAAGKVYRARFWEAYWVKHYAAKEQSREWD